MTGQELSTGKRPEAAPSGGRQPWSMPEWMHEYAPYFRNTGVPPTPENIEELINDHKTNGASNFIRAALIVAAESQAGLLSAMHRDGLLTSAQAALPPPEVGSSPGVV